VRCEAGILRDASKIEKEGALVMKSAGRRIGFAAAMLGGVLSVVAMSAQQDAPPPPPQGAEQGPPQGGPGGHGGRGGMMNPQRRIKMMTRELSLTPDQQTTIRQIFADEEAKMQAQKDSGQPMPDRRAMMAMRQEQKAKIEAVLTPDQKTKYEEMEAKMHEREKERRDQGPPPPPPPPQQ
jgi:protein CpxP